MPFCLLTLWISSQQGDILLLGDNTWMDDRQVQICDAHADPARTLLRWDWSRHRRILAPSQHMEDAPWTRGTMHELLVFNGMSCWRAFVTCFPYGREDSSVDYLMGCRALMSTSSCMSRE